MAQKPLKSQIVEMCKTRNPPWSELPQELLSTIASFLTTNSIDILTFRSVCKSWYSSSPSISPFILSLILPITAPYPAYSFDVRFFDRNFGVPIISVTKIFVLNHPEEETKSWVMFADQLTPGKIMIRQPFTKCYYCMPINFPRFIDVPNIHVYEIGRFYNLNFHSEMNKPPSMWSEYVNKVVLKSDESFAVALFHTGQLGSSKLRVFPNWDAGSWEYVYSCCYDDLNARIDDIVDYEGTILGVDRVGRVYEVGFSSSETRKIVPSIAGSGTKRKRLVESNGVLFLVVRESVGEESNGGVRFKVFVLDVVLGEWVEVSSLGGRIFFFGLDFSFSVSPDELGGSFKQNCIVYNKSSFKDYDEGVDDDGDDNEDSMVFSNLGYGDLQIWVWHMEDARHCGIIGSDPGYSNVIWPPPAWLWPIGMPKRIEDLETALGDLLMNAPAEKSKAMSKELSSQEQVVVKNDDVNQQDDSEIWRLAHTMKVCLNKAKDEHLESVKTHTLSRQQLCESINLQNQAGSSSHGTGDAFLSSEMKLNGIILHLEESTTKLQNILKSRQQSSIDAVE